MDPKKQAWLLQELHRPEDTSSKHSAALQLLGMGVGCPRTRDDRMLVQGLRRKCHEVLDSHSMNKRLPLTSDEAQRISQSNCLSALSFEDILKLAPFNILAEVKVDDSCVLPATSVNTRNEITREKNLQPNPWLKPQQHQTGDRTRNSSNPWATNPRQSDTHSRDRAEEDEKKKSDVSSPSTMMRSMTVSGKWSSRRPRDTPKDSLPSFESALKKIKEVPGFTRFGDSQAQARDDDDILERKGRRGVRSSFVPPMRADSDRPGGSSMFRNKPPKENAMEESTMRCLEELMDQDGQLPESLKNIEPKLVEQICNEILTRDTRTTWDDIAGLEHAKQCITETIIWPLKRPDLFRGTRAPSRGLLLFGPPGTGKTMIGKAIAGEIEATFFSISASSLTSKWIGEGEKLVRALFGVARCKQPAVIFIDEIDSLLSMRKSEGEHESSRRMKTQFLIEMEGCQGSEEQLLVIGATNRPQELDEAARRRLAKRLYVPLPESGARKQMVKHALDKDHLLSLSGDDLNTVAEKTEGYSGSDMSHLVREASMVPMREALKPGALASLKEDDVRPIEVQDFLKSLSKVRPSVSPSELVAYIEWNKEFGSTELA